MSSMSSPKHTLERPEISLMLYRMVRVSMLLLLGLVMTACCSTPVCPDREPETVIVGESDITENPDGTYTVTDGWMLRRLEMEQSLRSALERCEQAAE